MSYPIRFTFNNVSINSQVQGQENLSFYAFTFHNVSINSGANDSAEPTISLFTFHNVSINSRTEIRHRR